MHTNGNDDCWPLSMVWKTFLSSSSHSTFCVLGGLRNYWNRKICKKLMAWPREILEHLIVNHTYLPKMFHLCSIDINTSFWSNLHNCIYKHADDDTSLKHELLKQRLWCKIHSSRQIFSGSDSILKNYFCGFTLCLVYNYPKWARH